VFVVRNRGSVMRYNSQASTCCLHASQRSNAPFSLSSPAASGGAGLRSPNHPTVLSPHVEEDEIEGAGVQSPEPSVSCQDKLLPSAEIVTET